MTTKLRCSARYLLILLLATSAPAAAQVVETVGGRALGMGGAFVAVADDSSATWWNPAGPAAGPFLDLSLGRAVTGAEGSLPAGRDHGGWFALTTPPFGFSYYRLRLTDIQPFDPTGSGAPGREERRAGVPVRSLAVSQVGATLLHSLVSGVHLGATLKYVRGTFRASREDSLFDAGDLLDLGDDLEGGDAENRFDVDLGLLAVVGAMRAGLVVRNVTEPEFGEMALPRQARVGAAFDGERAGLGPFMVAVDADVLDYDTPTGERRVVAVGGERWFGLRRLAVRAGARVNTVGAQERTLTAGASYALRAALYVEGHVARGGSDDDRGWGLAARVSF